MRGLSWKLEEMDKSPVSFLKDDEEEIFSRHLVWLVRRMNSKGWPEQRRVHKKIFPFQGGLFVGWNTTPLSLQKCIFVSFRYHNKCFFSERLFESFAKWWRRGRRGRPRPGMINLSVIVVPCFGEWIPDISKLANPTSEYDAHLIFVSFVTPSHL